MGRVEKRMYKRRRDRRKLLLRLLLLGVLVLGGLILWHQQRDLFSFERLGLKGTEKSSAKDEKAETREVTLEAVTWYAIQTGVFSSEEAARQKADAYTERGAPGTVVQEGEKWRVFIACYDSEQDAAAVKNRLEQNQRVETYLYDWQCPELRLRMTGKTGQLDVVEAGFTLLLSAAAALRDTATELDAAQLTLQEAVAAMKDLDEQITLWESAIRREFGKKLPELPQQLMRISARWDERYDVLRKSEDATALSAALKAQGMGLYHEICTWRKAFAAQ